jgi:hypothetical protein
MAGYDGGMRRLLFIGGTILLACPVVVIYLAYNRVLPRLSFQWDADWLLEGMWTILLSSLWYGAVGIWCLCAAALTFPKIREKVAFIPIVLGLLTLATVVFITVGLNKSNPEIRVYHLYGEDGPRRTVVTRSGWTPSVCLWMCEEEPDFMMPDLEASMDCWPPQELRASKRKGRYLVVGTGPLSDFPTVGALIDLNVPTLIIENGMPSIEALREEFGSDLLPQPERQ